MSFLDIFIYEYAQQIEKAEEQYYTIMGQLRDLYISTLPRKPRKRRKRKIRI
jgi:hypothetical protein